MYGLIAQLGFSVAAKKLLVRLEGSELIALEHKGHINQEHFEELVKRIRNSN